MGAFEEHPVPEPFDAVVAATSFHWVPPAERVPRTVAALRPGGALAIVDVRHVAGGTTAFFAAMQDCYLRFFPGTHPGFRLPAADGVPAAYPELDDDAAFAAVQRRRHTWEVTYTAEGFTALLSTFSDHLDLPADRLDGLLDCLRTLAERRFGGVMTKRFQAELVVARRR